MQTQQDRTAKKNQTSPAMDECVQNCLDCYTICSTLLDHCLKKGGQHADPHHIKLLVDCAAICNLSADFMIRNSERHALICGACAEICAQCAESCEAIADDEMMRECVSACRKCAESCAQMAQEKH